MNKEERKEIKEQILKGLGDLPSSWTHFFKLKLSPDENRDIGDIVDEMEDGVLEWSLARVEESLSKLKD